MTQKVLFLCRAKTGRYIREPTSTASKGASSRQKGALLQSVVQKLDCEVGLCMAARRLPKSSNRDRDCPWVVYGERRFYFKLLLLRFVTSVATEQTTSFLAS